MIELDGSYGEGGGQMLRTGLALSMLTGKAFGIHSIRKNRPEPGLKPQHLTGIRLARDLCDAVVEGDELGSTKITFYPRKMKGRTISVDIGTAGSLTLLLQAVMPAVIFGPGKFRFKLTGGTDVNHSPPIDYLSNVLIPHLRKFADFEIEVPQRGFYPKGQGHLELRVKPKFIRNPDDIFDTFLKNNSFPKFNLTNKGKLLAIRGISFSSSELEQADVSERQLKSARHSFSKLEIPPRIDPFYAKTASPGSIITLWAYFGDNEPDENNPVVLGSSGLGEKGKRAEIVGKEAGDYLAEEIASPACVDKFMADQLLIYLAIAGGKITIPQLTNHCRSGIYVIEKFLGNVLKVEGNLVSKLESKIV